MSDPKIKLLFAQNHQLFFLARAKGDLQMWSINPLQCLDKVRIPTLKTFKLLALSKDNQYLITVARRPQLKEGSEKGKRHIRLSVCKIQTTIQASFQQQSVSSKVIRGNIRAVAFSANLFLIAAVIEARCSVEFYLLPQAVLKEEWTYPLGDNVFKVTAIQFTLDGKKLLLGMGKELHVLNYPTKQYTHLITEKTAFPDSIPGPDFKHFLI